MLYESPHIRVEADDGIATLWLEFPGTPVNALSPERLAEFGRALVAVEKNPHIEILVIRSGMPAGFCGAGSVSDGLSDEDAALFSLTGQRVLNRLAAASPVTVAFLEGPCLGPGLELALACDYRLAVTGPDAWLGFPTVPCWGGSARAPHLRVGELLTAREAQRIGLVDDAFCARRAKIELRTFLDRLQMRPRKRWVRNLDEALVAERKAWRTLYCSWHTPCADVGTLRVPTTMPELVGVVGYDALAVEVALRGGRAAICAANDNVVSLALAEAVRRGRATPLEAEQTRTRITVAPGTEHLANASWVVANTPPDGPLLPRAIVCVPSAHVAATLRRVDRPTQILGLDGLGTPYSVLRTHAGNSDATIATVAAWLGRLGVTVSVAPALGFASRLTAA